jgi:hypothetical protein
MLNQQDFGQQPLAPTKGIAAPSPKQRAAGRTARAKGLNRAEVREKLSDMKRSTLLQLLLLAALAAPAQTVLTGTVRTPEGQPGAYSPVLLFADPSPEALPIRSTLTAPDGSFVLTMPDSASLFLEIQVSGYQKKTLPLAPAQAGDSLRLGILLMEGLVLDAVAIEAKKPLLEVRPDKMVLNVAGSLLSVGSDAWTLLRKAPGVTADPSDNLSLMGQPGVAVWLDGRPSPVSGAELAQWLRSLPADAIESIEIIAQPSSRYDAAGTGGIINIILKKGLRPGRSSTLTTGWAVGRLPKYNLSLDAGSKIRNGSLFGQYSLRHGHEWSYIRLFRQQQGLSLNQLATTVSHNTDQNLRLAGSFSAGKAHQFGFSANGNLSHMQSLNQSQTPIAALATGELQSTLLAQSDQTLLRGNLSANANYSFRPTDAFSLSTDLDAGRYRRDSETFQPNRYLGPDGLTELSRSLFSIAAPAQIDLWSAKADMSSRLPLGTLEYGLKFSWVETDNDFGFFEQVGTVLERNGNLSNRFLYSEQIAAGYVAWKGGKNGWDLQAGLRAEQTWGLGRLIGETPSGNERFERSYFNLFPSLGITRSAGQRHRFSASYARRVDRPAYQELNPFQSKLDELSYSSGNPFLLPEFTHKIQLSHTFNYAVSTSLSVNTTRNVTIQLTDTIEGRRSFLRPENLAQQQGMSLNFSAPWSPVKGWDLYASLTASWNRFEGEFAPGKGIYLEAFSANVYAQSSWSIRSRTSVEVSGFYSTPGIWGGTYRSKEFWGVDAGVKTTFFQERLTARATVSDIFWGMQWGGVSEFGGLLIEAGGGWESRLFRVSLSAQLGDRNTRLKKGKSGAEEETQRIR